MIRFIAVAFVLALASSAQAMSPAPLHQPNGMITQVREACGASRVRINGVCVARTTKRHVRREVHWSAKAPPGFRSCRLSVFRYPELITGQTIKARHLCLMSKSTETDDRPQPPR